MLNLALAVLILGVGPLLFRLLQRSHTTRELLNGFVLASVGALVIVHVLPQAVVTIGGWALLAAVAGLAVPAAVERFSHVTAHRAHRSILVFVVVSFLFHAALDGAALSVVSLQGHATAPLAGAVLVHRVPVGLAVWWLVRPRQGRTMAAAVLAAVAGATIFGYFLAGSLDVLSQVDAFAVFQAFVGGALLHVVFHVHHARDHDRIHEHDHDQPHDHDPPPTDSCCDSTDTCAPDTSGAQFRWPEALGFVLGLSVLFLFSAEGAEHGHQIAVDYGAYLDRFLDLSLESAPALLIGYTLAGVVAVYLPDFTTRFASRGGALSQSLRGTAMGLPVPICSCGIVPVYRGLVRRGMPPTAAMAFFVATPELGVESLLLSVPLLGWELTGARLAAAFVLAIVVGVVVGRMVPPSETVEEESATEHDESKLRRAIRFGFAEVVDDTAPWILLGLAVAALIGPGFASEWVAALPAGVDVGFFALVGIPIYVCASGATPLAAALIFAGVSPGAAIAFLLAGPATNVTTFGVLSQAHGKRVALVFGAVVVGLAIGIGVLVNLVIDPGMLSAVELAHDEGSTLQWIALGALALIVAVSVVRVGPRRFLGTLTIGEQSHAHE